MLVLFHKQEAVGASLITKLSLLLKGIFYLIHAFYTSVASNLICGLCDKIPLNFLTLFSIQTSPSL